MTCDRAEMLNFFFFNYYGWYEIYTRSRHEKLVASTLQAKGFDVLLPIHQVKRQLSFRRHRLLALPLFPGYVFAHFVCNARNYHCIKVSDGVVSIVGGQNSPTSIPESQIEMVRKIMQIGACCHPTAYLRRGDPVDVTAGPLAGLRGRFIRQKGKGWLVLTLDMLNRSILVEIDAGLLGKLAVAV